MSIIYTTVRTQAGNTVEAGNTNAWPRGGAVGGGLLGGRASRPNVEHDVSTWNIRTPRPGNRGKPTPAHLNDEVDRPGRRVRRRPGTPLKPRPRMPWPPGAPCSTWNTRTPRKTGAGQPAPDRSTTTRTPEEKTGRTPTGNAVEAPTPNALGPRFQCLTTRSAMFHVEHPHAAGTGAPDGDRWTTARSALEDGRSALRRSPPAIASGSAGRPTDPPAGVGGLLRPRLLAIR